jgi:hypothetical protein
MSAPKHKADNSAEERRPPLQRKQPSPPEKVRGRARPMTGFFQGLTAEQKKRALEYGGPDWHGDEEKAPRVKKETVPA